MKTYNLIPMILLVFVILVVLPAQALNISDYKINYDIQKDLSVKETISVRFQNSIHIDNINYTLDRLVYDIIVNDGYDNIKYNLLSVDEKYIISIFPAKPVQQLIISFRINDYIYVSGDSNVFFSESMLSEESDDFHVLLILPEGYGIIENQYFPKNAEIKSDGRRVSLNWDMVDKNFSITAKFEPLNKDFNIFIPITVILTGIIVVVFIFFRKRSQKEFYSGFSEDELKTINYLEQHPQTYQNKIEQEFKFSRAKMTRIMQKLEAKQLVEKKRKGRTNRIIWKR